MTELGMAEYGQFVAALLAVVGLIIGLGWVAKRINLADRLMRGRSGKRLHVVEQLPVDNGNRLAIIRCDDREHLILIQRQGAMLIDRAGSSTALDTTFADKV